MGPREGGQGKWDLCVCLCEGGGRVINKEPGGVEGVSLENLVLGGELQGGGGGRGGKWGHGGVDG